MLFLNKMLILFQLLFYIWQCVKSKLWQSFRHPLWDARIPMAAIGLPQAMHRCWVSGCIQGYTPKLYPWSGSTSNSSRQLARVSTSAGRMHWSGEGRASTLRKQCLGCNLWFYAPWSTKLPSHVKFLNEMPRDCVFVQFVHALKAKVGAHHLHKKTGQTS